MKGTQRYTALDHGYVKFIDCMGGDQRVVQSARISYDKAYRRISIPGLHEKDEKLIHFLMKHSHGTPFESSVFTLEIKCPIFVARQWMRHRMASYTEKSLSYVKAKPEFYIPDKFLRKEVEKGKFEELDDSAAVTHFMLASQYAWDGYQDLLIMGVAKELARIVLPVNIYTTFLFTVNARSLMNFLELRNAPNALREIQEYAILLEKIFEQKMPVTYEAFIQNGRKAP